MMQLPVLYTSMRVIFLSGTLLLAASGCASKTQRANDAFVQAQQYITDGKVPDAKRELLRAISIRDDIPDIWFALGQMQLSNGELAAAFSALGRADELRPGDLNTLRPLAYSGYMIGATRLAQDATDRLLALAPDDPQGLAVKGLLALDKGEPKITLEAAETILKLAPNDETGLLLKARAIAIDGNVDGAILLLQEASKTPGPHPSLNFALLQFYRAKGDLAGMQSVFPEVVRTQKDNPEIALDYSNLLYRTGKIDEARKIWSDVVVTKRDDSRFIAWAFELYDNAEPTDQPAHLDDRLTKMGGSPLRSAAGQYLITRKEYARAVALITQGKGEADVDRGMYAVALDGLGKRAEAHAMVDSILGATNARQEPYALMLRARWAIAAKSFERARTDAQSAIVGDPSNLEARFVLAQSYIADQQPLRVRQVLAEAVRDLPRSRRALSAYVQYLQSIGDHASAVAAARNFAEANVSQPWSWSTLIATCQRANDAVCLIGAKRRHDISTRDFSFVNPSRPFKTRGLFSQLPNSG